MNNKNKKLMILFLDILTDDPKLEREIDKKIYNGSTYADVIRSVLGLDKKQFIYRDASSEKLPNPKDYSAIVMGGSVMDPIEGQEKLWMKKVYNFIKEASSQKIPILGICGGLQFTVRALGGEVIYNPQGRNFGNSTTKLTEEGKQDLLFRGLPNKITVQSSHKCIAKNLKPEWKLLASSDKSPFDAIAIGDNIRLVQFHPEMLTRHIKALAKMRKKALIKEGFITPKEFTKFLESIKDTSKVGRMIAGNFIKYFVVD